MTMSQAKLRVMAEPSEGSGSIYGDTGARQAEKFGRGSSAMTCSLAMVVGGARARRVMTRGRFQGGEERATVAEVIVVLVVLSDGSGKDGARRIKVGVRRLETRLTAWIRSARQSSGHDRWGRSS